MCRGIRLRVENVPSPFPSKIVTNCLAGDRPSELLTARSVLPSLLKSIATMPCGVPDHFGTVTLEPAVNVPSPFPSRIVTA